MTAALDDTATARIARLDDALQRRGETVILRTGNTIVGQVSVRGSVRTYGPDEIVGLISAQDREVTVQPDGTGDVRRSHDQWLRRHQRHALPHHLRQAIAPRWRAHPHRSSSEGLIMPVRPARICSCGKRVASGVRCACQQARERERPTARQRGYDTSFQKEASEFLKAHPTCTCGKPAVLVRHKVSIHLRPDLRMDRSNWLPGCRSCNAKDMHRERQETGGGSRLSAIGGGTARVKSARFARNRVSSR